MTCSRASLGSALWRSNEELHTLLKGNAKETATFRALLAQGKQARKEPFEKVKGTKLTLRGYEGINGYVNGSLAGFMVSLMGLQH